MKHTQLRSFWQQKLDNHDCNESANPAVSLQLGLFQSSAGSTFSQHQDTLEAHASHFFRLKQVWNQLTSITPTSATFVDLWVIRKKYVCRCLGTPRGKRASRIYSWPSPSCESSEIGYSKSTDSKVSAFITDSIRTKRANKFWKALRCSWQGSLCIPPTIGLRSSILNG